MALIEALQKVLNENLFLTELQVLRSFVEEVFFPFFQSLLSLEWVQSFAFYPILEAPILDGQRGAISIVNSFVLKKENTFFLGLFNSFFLSLPFSVSHFVLSEKLLLEEKGLGKGAILGLVLGKWAFSASVLLGFRSIVIPYLSLEPFNFLLFVGLLIHGFFKQLVSSKGLKRARKENPFKSFAFTFALAWAEEGCAFRYLGNVHLGPSSLPLLSKGSLFLDQLYLFALLLGTLFFTFFFFLSFKDRIFNLLSTSTLFPLKRYYQRLDLCFSDLKTFFFVSYVCLSTFFVPFYGPAYLLTTPLGLENSHFFKVQRPQYYYKENRMRSKSIKRYSQPWPGSGSFNSRNYTSLSTFEKANLKPTMSSPYIYKRHITVNKIQRYKIWGKKPRFYQFFLDLVPAIKNRRQILIDKKKKVLRAKKKRDKKKRVKRFLKNNEQRKEKREKLIGKQGGHTRGERVLNRLKDKERAGKTEIYNSRRVNRGSYWVNGKKKFLLRIEENVGEGTKQGFSKVRKDLEERFEKSFETFQLNKLDESENLLESEDFLESEDLLEAEDLLKKNVVKKKKRNKVINKIKEKLKALNKNLNKNKKQYVSIAVGLAVVFFVLKEVNNRPKTKDIQEPEEEEQIEESEQAEEENIKKEEEENKKQEEEENKKQEEEEEKEEDKEDKEKIREIHKTANNYYLEQREHTNKTLMRDKEKIEAIRRILLIKHYIEKNKVVPLTPNMAERFKREREDCRRNLTMASIYLKERSAYIGTDEHCFTRDTIKEWQIQVTKIDDSKEQPLTIDIVRREEKKASAPSDDEKEKEDITSRCNINYKKQLSFLYDVMANRNGQKKKLNNELKEIEDEEWDEENFTIDKKREVKARAKDIRVKLNEATNESHSTILARIDENGNNLEDLRTGSWLTEKEKKKWKVESKRSDSGDALILDFVRKVPKTQEKERHKEEEKEDKKEEDKASVQSSSSVKNKKDQRDVTYRCNKNDFKNLKLLTDLNAYKREADDEFKKKEAALIKKEDLTRDEIRSLEEKAKEKKKWEIQGTLTDSEENFIVDFIRKKPKTQEKERHKEEDKEAGAWLTEKEWEVQGTLTDSEENFYLMSRLFQTQKKERHKEEDKKDKASVQSNSFVDSEENKKYITNRCNKNDLRNLKLLTDLDTYKREAGDEFKKIEVALMTKKDICDFKRVKKTSKPKIRGFFAEYLKVNLIPIDIDEEHYIEPDQESYFSKNPDVKEYYALKPLIYQERKLSTVVKKMKTWLKTKNKGLKARTEMLVTPKKMTSEPEYIIYSKLRFYSNVIEYKVIRFKNRFIPRYLIQTLKIFEKNEGPELKRFKEDMRLNQFTASYSKELKNFPRFFSYFYHFPYSFSFSKKKKRRFVRHKEHKEGERHKGHLSKKKNREKQEMSVVNRRFFKGSTLWQKVKMRKSKKQPRRWKKSRVWVNFTQHLVSTLQGYSYKAERLLTCLKVDNFLLNVPNSQKVTVSEEKDLFRKRVILKMYYDNLRLYKGLPSLTKRNFILVKKKEKKNVWKSVKKNLKKIAKYRSLINKIKKEKKTKETGKGEKKETKLFGDEKKKKKERENKKRKKKEEERDNKIKVKLLSKLIDKPLWKQALPEKKNQHKKSFQKFYNLSKNNGDGLFAHQFYGSRSENQNKFASQFLTREGEETKSILPNETKVSIFKRNLKKKDSFKKKKKIKKKQEEAQGTWTFLVFQKQRKQKTKSLS